MAGNSPMTGTGTSEMFSKSGVGWSVAPIPGFICYVKSATGRRNWRFSLPGTGNYYETYQVRKGPS